MIGSNSFLTTILLSALAGIGVALWLARYVLSQAKGNEKMEEVGKAIQSGANAYLKRQFSTISSIILILAIFLYFTAPNPGLALGRSLAFLMGAAFSALVGTVGMNLATRVNVKVAQAANRSFSEALTLAFRSGATTGMLTVGLGLLGATLIYWY